MLGFTLVEPSDIQDISGQVALLWNEYDLSLSFPQLPTFDLSRVEVEWKKFTSNIPEVWKLSNDGREFMVGEEMKARGLSAEYPVILVPGIVSTGLESWSTDPAYRPFFRQKMWGGFHMLSQVTFNRDRWITALMLDPVTGLDPPGIKVRAAEGFDAASVFVQGYWIWSKVIENLAVVNYDTNNLLLAPYDWRLSYSNLEVRDGYFSRLKSQIEGFKRRQGKKTVITAHSMGSSVSDRYSLYTRSSALNSFKWVESPQHGGGGPNWVEDHIHAFISIAGTHLAKAMAALLSGEMKDTVQINPAGAYVLERFFSKKERQKLFRSWAGSASMWIKGGEAIWGNASFAPDDEPGSSLTHGELIAFRRRAASPPPDKEDTAPILRELDEAAHPLVETQNMTAAEAGVWILEHTPATFQKMIETNYSYGIERDEKQLKKNDADPRTWSNPLESRLPNAPSMGIYCVYGHGKETERSYLYASGPYEYDDTTADAAGATCPGGEDCETPRPPLDMPFSRTSWIDSEFTDETITPKIRNGVKMGEGDGTVSLLSLGAMCAEGWKKPRYNPAGIRVVTVELPHRPVPSIPRGGANTSDHVDILGSTGLNEIILKVATGVGHEVQDNYVSRIREYVKKMQWD
ncbi:phospholipid/diacylglycerol acyltransferase [Dentipellis sp. KUC8613]|nr:phospholipid/diacylglycerol acyltransferase [Dentipellis sp. KUC8613]